MAVSFAPYAAYNARVRMNNLTLVANKWAVNVRVDDIDATNFEGGGYAEQITGVVSADVTIEFLYDGRTGGINNSLVNSGNNIVPTMTASAGYDYVNVKLYPNNVDNAASSFSFPLLTLTGVSTDADVHGAVRIVLTAKSDGPFTYPV